LHILVAPGFAAEFGERLRDEAARVGADVRMTVIPADPAERLAPEVCAPITVAFHSNEATRSHAESFFDALSKAPGIQWVQSFLAGTDAPVYAPLRERGIRLVGSIGSNAEPLASSTIGGMLVLARNFVPWIVNQQHRLWKPVPPQRDIEGQTITIFGFGSIGQAVGRVAQALGMHVIGVRRSPAQPGDHADEVIHPSLLDEVLPRTDWLVITAPLTDETRGRFDARALALLPQGARLINVARGPIVDQHALISALESGHLGGAFLDAHHIEPLPAESPLWGFPNVVISPHGSSGSPGNTSRASAMFIDNVVRYWNGEPLRGAAPA